MSISPSLPAQPPSFWTESNIYTKGPLLLGRQAYEVSSLLDLFKASNGKDKSGEFNASTSIRASKKEIDALNNAVEPLLLTASTKGPLTEQGKELARITLATRQILNFYKFIETNMPKNDHDQRLAAIEQGVDTAAAAFVASLGVLVASTFLPYSDKLWNSAYHCTFASTLALLGTSAISNTYKNSKMESRIKEAMTLKRLFEQTMAADPSTIQISQRIKVNLATLPTVNLR